MENVTKVYFDPLLDSEGKIRAFLKNGLPVGSAHPFNGTLLLLSGIDEISTIDISMHPEEYFSNAISLGNIGEDVLDQMKQFPELSSFNDEYNIQQAPASTFEIPIQEGKIHIFAISKLLPTYYDLCVGEAGFKTCCYCATETFRGMAHSGDVAHDGTLLHHIEITKELDNEARCVFVSGYSHTQLTKFKEKNPLVMVVNHETKAMYIIPVPLDEASIGKATLCSPLVIKKNPRNNTLVCSILPTPTTDDDHMCSGSTLPSPSFKSAINRANFTVDTFSQIPRSFVPSTVIETTQASSVAASVNKLDAKTVILATLPVVLPQWNSFQNDSTHVIRFGNGIKWMANNHEIVATEGSSTVLPCVLGGVLEGPLLLATGHVPSDLPFTTSADLQEYYRQAENVIVVVDERMTDNARNLATSLRLNGLFIIQKHGKITDHSKDLSILNEININAITAIAGPQSLVVIQLNAKYYFYRGIANPTILDTASLNFGQEITEILTTIDIGKLMLPQWPRLVNLSQKNVVYLPRSKQEVELDELKAIFERITFDEVLSYKDDILMAVPQLQSILPQEKLQDFCSGLVVLVAEKFNKQVVKAKKEYSQFVTKIYNDEDLDSRKTRDKLLGAYRRVHKEARTNIGWLTDALGNVVSTQTSSTRGHDIKRLIRQNNIQTNVNAVKSMTFERLAEMLEDNASEMGVLITNVHTEKYQSYLNSVNAGTLEVDMTAKQVCDLDSRTLFLEGIDAGIVLEQSQKEHDGPLASLQGREQPILAMPYLNKNTGTGSMLAWVCWDEFVSLEDPYSVRWMEKCNDAHIAALRIMMRGTLSSAVCSRKFSMTSGSLEAGQLMGSLLMAAMFKLAATRNTPPGTVVKAEDTSMKLMRGLFGHLLTMAGSGAKPMSFVWQLFGKFPQLDIPATANAWSWYENTVELVPYTGWPIKQFKNNLASFLNKVIFRMITKNELNTNAASARPKPKAEYCKARNIQLEHMRTIISVLEKMLQMDDCKVAAERLLQTFPEHMEHETNSYTRLRFYVKHLARGGTYRPVDNLIAANVISRRSAMFRNDKKALAEAVKNSDDAETHRQGVIEACQNIIQKRTELEIAWRLDPGSVHVQCMPNIQKLLDVSLAGDAPEKDMIARATGDVETIRVAWQVGHGSHIEALDEKLMVKILSGGPNEDSLKSLVVDESLSVDDEKDEFEEFSDSIKPDFLLALKFAKDTKAVCKALSITEGALTAFARMLAPEFRMEYLVANFREVVLSLLKVRNRDKLWPSRQLFAIAAIEKKA